MASAAARGLNHIVQIGKLGRPCLFRGHQLTKKAMSVPSPSPFSPLVSGQRHGFGVDAVSRGGHPMEH